MRSLCTKDSKMQQFRNILVGVDLSHGDRICTSDLSETTQHAVERAIWLAGMVKAELTFFAAIEVSPQTEELLAEDLDPITRDVRAAADTVLSELVSRAKQAGIAACSGFELGKPWREIIRQVLRGKHDLAIVGTRQRGSLARAVFGSTAMKLLRACPCPVWVTKPGDEPEVTNILVASDFSEVAQQALETAVNAGQLTDARLHLLHSLEFEFENRIWLSGVTEEKMEIYRAQARAAAERKLHEQLTLTDYRTLSHGVQVQVVDGPAHDVILQTIEEEKVDLLVMGTAARSGFRGLVVGNTAERLLAEVPCSILAVKPADFECPITLD